MKYYSSEQAEELRQVTSRFLIKFYIENEFPKNKEFRLDIVEFVSSIKSPSELDKILGEMGWIREEFDTNGWQQDTWYYYSHPDYDFGLTMEYSGFYGGLELYRSGI